MASWPVWGSGATEPGQLDVGGEAVGDEEDAVAIAGLGLAEVDVAGERAGQGGAVELRVPTLENSGHWASSVGAECALRRRSRRSCRRRRWG